jgi:hypothetical protein
MDAGTLNAGQSARRRTDRRDQQPCIAFDLALVFASDFDLTLILAKSANPPDPLSCLTSLVFLEQSIILSDVSGFP